MLRCTVAGLLPIMMSTKYSGQLKEIFANRKNHFESIVKNESWYILRYMPQDIAKILGEAPLRATFKRQRKTGLWKVKDAERITYDIYAAIKHIGILDECLSSGLIKYDTLACIEENYDFFPLLIKKNIFSKLSGKDHSAINKYTGKILSEQLENGSWGNTVTATSVNLENLMELGLNSEDTSVKRGSDFLFENLNRKFSANHVGKPYGFDGEYMFSSQNRHEEFSSAQSLKPEWIPRAVCFHHMGMIQNSIALITLIKLGFGRNDSVIRAVDNLFDIYSKYNGFCDSDIKKKYIAENGIRL